MVDYNDMIDPDLRYMNWREFRILFLDTETTMLDHEHEDFRVVQYAGAVYEHGKMISSETLNIIINPGIPIPEGSSKIHGIYDKDVEGAPTFRDVYSKILNQINSVDMVCAFNYRFDRRALNTELRRNGLHEIVSPFFDPLVYRREKNGFSKNKLEDLGRAYGCSTMGRVTHGDNMSLHNALVDVMLLAEVAFAMAPSLPFTYGQLIEEQEGFLVKHDEYYAKKYPNRK